MKLLNRILAVASAAFFIAGSAFAQTSGTVTNHAFIIGKGAGTTGYTSLLCGSAQLAVGQSAADPICKTITGDVTITAAGVTAIGATKVTSAMLNADVFSTAHSWAGQQTFVAPILGTPASGTLTNATGLPISTGVSGLGTGVATALGVNVGTAGAVVVNGGALGTPSSGTLTSATGLPVSTGISGLGTGVATFLATPSSANLRAALTDEVGTGAAYFVGGALGTPASGTATNLTGLPLSGLTAQAAYTIVANNSGSSAVPTAVDVTAITAKASPVSADIVLIQDSAASNAFKRTTVGAMASAGSVSSIAGNTGAFTLSTGITNSTNDIRLALNNATLQATPANPTGTSSATDVMMGVGTTCKLTPVYSSRIRLEFHIGVANGAIANASVLTAKFGTGTAPTNGAAVTGTSVGTSNTVSSPGASFQANAAIGGIITGLTPGTAYWFDVALHAQANTSTIQSIDCNAMEF